MSAKGSSNGWDRVNFNVRLTKRRREQLKSLAADLPLTATPVDVVDRAIALALQARAGHVAGERLYDLEDLIEQHAMKSLFEFDKMGEGLGAVKKSMDDLRALISAVAGTEERPHAGGDRAAPLAFGPWMDRELAARKLQRPREAVVRAAWRATAMKSQRVVYMDFDATLISVDGKPARVAAAGLAGVRFEADLSSDLAAAWRHGPLALRCVALTSGWKLHAHQAGQDGSLERLLTTLDA